MSYEERSMSTQRLKTGKREVAIASLVFLGGFFVWGVFNPIAMEAAKFLTLPVFTVVGGAFGLDYVSKQFR